MFKSEKREIKRRNARKMVVRRGGLDAIVSAQSKRDKRAKRQAREAKGYVSNI